jgi:CBS domain-containing protein
MGALGVAHGVRPGSTGLAMLCCFAAGMSLSNASPHSGQLFRYLENTVYPLYVLFFLGAGRDLHVEAMLSAGALGVLFVLARASGKVVGGRLGLRLARWEESLPSEFGAGLLCQAGVALGLVAALEAVEAGVTKDLRSVVVASVVFFELVGPWLVRRTAVRAGEVKLANLLSPPEATGVDALRWVWTELRRNLGLLRGDLLQPDGAPTVMHAMRRRPATVPESAPFERVLRTLGDTGADVLPVLGPDGAFAGVISYEEVKNALYDPALRGLVIAGDLTIPVDDPLAPGDSLASALERMDRHRVQSWPVVEEARLVGIARRSDLYGLMRRQLA